MAIERENYQGEVLRDRFTFRPWDPLWYTLWDGRPKHGCSSPLLVQGADVRFGTRSILFGCWMIERPHNRRPFPVRTRKHTRSVPSVCFGSQSNTTSVAGPSPGTRGGFRDQVTFGPGTTWGTERSDSLVRVLTHLCWQPYHA